MASPDVRLASAGGRALAGAIVFMSVLLPLWIGNPVAVIVQTAAVGALALAVFGVLESWPLQLPQWLPLAARRIRHPDVQQSAVRDRARVVRSGSSH